MGQKGTDRCDSGARGWSRWCRADGRSGDPHPLLGPPLRPPQPSGRPGLPPPPESGILGVHILCRLGGR
ncbi:MAG TPA: hypothetical protein EYH34_03055 [Planctomycetes bacterium]|nr:hypothetical protein [Planctomycetota bacterium]